MTDGRGTGEGEARGITRLLREQQELCLQELLSIHEADGKEKEFKKQTAQTKELAEKPQCMQKTSL